MRNLEGKSLFDGAVNNSDIGNVTLTTHCFFVRCQKSKRLETTDLILNDVYFLKRATLSVVYIFISNVARN